MAARAASCTFGMPSSGTAMLPDMSIIITTVAAGNTFRWRTSKSTGRISAIGVS
jgi:hypothetical protein